MVWTGGMPCCFVHSKEDVIRSFVAFCLTEILPGTLEMQDRGDDEFWVKCLGGCAGVAGLAPGSRWLITGGMGGLGCLFARWAAAAGAAHLCLADVQPGARAPDLAAAQACVTLLRADVGVAEGARAALLAGDGACPMGGVMHAAGVLQVQLSCTL